MRCLLKLSSKTPPELCHKYVKLSSKHQRVEQASHLFTVLDASLLRQRRCSHRDDSDYPSLRICTCVSHSSVMTVSDPHMLNVLLFNGKRWGNKMFTAPLESVSQVQFVRLLH